MIPNEVVVVENAGVVRQMTLGDYNRPDKFYVNMFVIRSQQFFQYSLSRDAAYWEAVTAMISYYLE